VPPLLVMCHLWTKHLLFVNVLSQQAINHLDTTNLITPLFFETPVPSQGKWAVMYMYGRSIDYVLLLRFLELSLQCRLFCFSPILFIVISLTRKMHVTFVVHYFVYSVEYCVDVSNATEAYSIVFHATFKTISKCRNHGNVLLFLYR
jgi:hypothetical protein